MTNSKNVLTGTDPVADKTGRLFLDGQMTQAVLSQALASAMYVGEIFRDGQSVTAKYTTNAKPGDLVRVPLETAFPSSSRTLNIAGAGGTAGNGGLINKNAPVITSEDEFAVKLNQLNDQIILFPELSMNWLPMDKIAVKLAGYAKSVVEDRSASTLAEILAYNIYRSLNNSGANLNTIDTTQQYAYGTLLNAVNAKLDNGDALVQAHTYPTQGRCIIGRPSFVNNMFSTFSGVLVTGSDIAMEMLRDYKFDLKIGDDFVGNAYKGRIMNFDIQVAPDYIWLLAEKYLGLTAGALDNVLAIAVSMEATALSNNIDLGVQMIPHSGNPRGLEAQPLNCWGHEAFRLSQIIGNTSLSNTTFTTAGFTADTRARPVASQNQFTTSNTNTIVVPVYALDGTIVGYQTVANVPKPNGNNFSSQPQYVSVTATLTGCTVTAGTTGTTAGALNTPYNTVIKAASGKTLPASLASITVGGTALDASLYTYTKGSGTATLTVKAAAMTGALAYTCTAQPQTVSVTATLTGCTATANTTGATAGAINTEYVTTLTPAAGKTMPASLAAITVGGTALTASQYSYVSTEAGAYRLTVTAAAMTGALAFTCTAT